MQQEQPTEVPQEVQENPITCCDQAKIEGDVKFGEGCILHPGCDIRANGPISFGDFNIVEVYVSQGKC
jgi:hypothetical protein